MPIIPLREKKVTGRKYFPIKSHKLCRDIFVDVDKIFLYVLCAFILELACTRAMHTIFIYINFKSQTKIKN
jgi:hypothetical protein